MDDWTKTMLQSHNVSTLRELCKAHKLSYQGKKVDIVARMLAFKGDGDGGDRGDREMKTEREAKGPKRQRSEDGCEQPLRKRMTSSRPPPQADPPQPSSAYRSGVLPSLLQPDPPVPSHPCGPSHPGPSCSSSASDLSDSFFVTDRAPLGP
eukprot:Platyproteum_vivax@DN3215_c0_g1_i1.p1